MSQTRSTTAVLNKALEGNSCQMQGKKMQNNGANQLVLGLGTLGYIGVTTIFLSHPVGAGYLFCVGAGSVFGVILTSAGVHNINTGALIAAQGEAKVDLAKREAEVLQKDIDAEIAELKDLVEELEDKVKSSESPSETEDEEVAAPAPAVVDNLISFPTTDDATMPDVALEKVANMSPRMK